MLSLFFSDNLIDLYSSLFILQLVHCEEQCKIIKIYILVYLYYNWWRKN